MERKGEIPDEAFPCERRLILNTKDPSPTLHSPDSNWHILGELRLPVQAVADNVISVWLKETLQPLNIDADFLHNILNSVKIAVARIQRPELATNFGGLHLVILIAVDYVPGIQNWGFFQIHKLKDLEENSLYTEQKTEFYFYQEPSGEV